MTQQTLVKTKTERMARTFRPVMASSATELPTRIELLKVGMWDTPNHGMFMVSSDDLAQYKENFDNGVAQAGDSGIMIDYDHESRFGKSVAAGWIKGLDIATDENGIETLFADPVEWTEQGKTDLLGKNYKCISPEFYPASRGGWEDPEQYGHYIENVLAAAGLVNRPLFKGLKPIMASADSKLDREEKIFISASEKETQSMTLEEVRAKELSALTEEEKTFLVEHKEELTAEEQTKFGMEVTANQETEEQKKEREAAEAKAAEEKAAAEAAANAQTPDLSKAQPVAASAVTGNEGNVVVAASEVKRLYEVEQKSIFASAEAFVKEHIARGAIRADQLKPVTEMLVAASGTHRTQLEETFKNLPDNAVAAGEQGSDAGVTGSAQEELHRKTTEAVTASAGKLDYRDAMKQVLESNADLNKRVSEERKSQTN